MLDDNVPQPWRARTTLVLALTLVAIGLGNLQRMPYLIGEYGGGPFFLTYIVALCVLSVPVMIAEVTLGSLGRGSPGLALHWAASAANVDSRWRILGMWQATLAVVLAAVAALTAVWCLHWAGFLYSGELASASAIEVADAFVHYVDDRAGRLMLLLLVLATAGSLSCLGIRFGMGFLAWACLPAVAITLFGVLDFVFVYGDLRPVEEFLFAKQPSRWSTDGLYQAVGAAMVTLGTGLGLGMALGAQSPPDLPWGRSVLAVAVLDSTFVLITAVIVSTLMLNANIAPAPGLAAVFIGLPYAFVNLPLGEVYGALFFGALGIISWSAAALLLEPAVMLLANVSGLGRVSGAVLAATLASVVAAVTLFADETAFIAVGGFIARWALPASVLLTAVFTGWLLPRPVLRSELYREPYWLFRLWWWLLRWCVPPICFVWLIAA
ncbi:sodium-dependent transporter [Luminiphilus sp.]|nr:sodium-dependent transporter [Luminiphilus sp.]MDA9710945.1 sodium-dependent transporter [Luminiphilus sp.]